MSEALERMLNAVANTFQAAWRAVLSLGLTPVQWGVVLGGALIAVLLVVVLLRRRKARAPKQPQLLISRGDIAQAENSSLQHLTLKLSNLNDYPVQLLELALKTDLMPHPMTIEAVELVPPHQAVELEAALPTDIVGDRGLVYAYAHTPRQRGAVYRLQASFAWEPWNKRYKISPLGQSLRPARHLSSSQLDTLRQHAWLERNPHLRSGPASASPAPTSHEPEPQPEADTAKKKSAWEFPQEF